VLLENTFLYEEALNPSQKEFSMRLHSKALAMAMAATLPLASGMAAPLHATTPLLGKSNGAMPCEHNSHVDASLQVCAIARAGITHYQIDTVDGTHAELILTESAVELRQFGPDSVRVRLGAKVDATLNAMPTGIVRTVYRDAVLSIDEVQEGALPPTWRIDLNSNMQPTRKTCDTAACSGHIQQHMDIPPTMQTTQ
jgi:hypothetical protein